MTLCVGKLRDHSPLLTPLRDTPHVASSFGEARTPSHNVPLVELQLHQTKQAGRAAPTAVQPLTEEEPPKGMRRKIDVKEAQYERFGSTSIVKADKMYVFGGIAVGGVLASNELLQFDLLSHNWSYVASYGTKPPGRFFHSATLSEDGKIMYITGGTPCFARIFMESLDFEDANGNLPPERQHAFTEALSIEHSEGLDDVYAFNFDTREWKELKPATDLHMTRCKAASNVLYQSGATSQLPSALYLGLLSLWTLAR